MPTQKSSKSNELDRNEDDVDLETRVSRLEGRIDSMDDRIGDIRKMMSQAISAAAETATDRVEDTEELVDDLNDDVDDLNDDVTDIKQKLGGMESSSSTGSDDEVEYEKVDELRLEVIESGRKYTLDEMKYIWETWVDSGTVRKIEFENVPKLSKAQSRSLKAVAAVSAILDEGRIGEILDDPVDILERKMGMTRSTALTTLKYAAENVGYILQYDDEIKAVEKGGEIKKRRVERDDKYVFYASSVDYYATIINHITNNDGCKNTVSEFVKNGVPESDYYDLYVSWDDYVHGAVGFNRLPLEYMTSPQLMDYERDYVNSDENGEMYPQEFKRRKSDGFEGNLKVDGVELVYV